MARSTSSFERLRAVQAVGQDAEALLAQIDGEAEEVLEEESPLGFSWHHNYLTLSP